MTISINGNQYTYNYSQNRNVKEPNPTLSYGSNSIFDNYNGTSVQTTGVSNISDACTDGADDGKISFGEKASSFIKGIFSPVTNMFKSPENFIKGALTIAGGAALCAVTGGAAAPFLVAAGVVGGGVQVVKGAINASNATTDAEAKAAWEDMGCGTGVVAGSVIGAKSAAKAAGIEGAENMSALQATKACFKYSGQKVGGLFTGSSSAAGAAASTTGAKTPTETNSKPAEAAAENQPKVKQKDMTADQKIEKMKADAQKQEINAQNQREAQYEYNEQHKVKFEAEQKQARLDAENQSVIGKENVETGKKAYAEQKAENTRNRTHDNKKIANQGAREARDNQLVQEKNQNMQMSENVQKTKGAAADAKNVRQGMQNETNATEINKTVENARNSAAEAQKSATEARQIAEQNPTHKNRLNAQRAENNARQAELEASKTEARAQQRIEEIQENGGASSKSKGQLQEKKANVRDTKSMEKLQKRGYDESTLRQIADGKHPKCKTSADRNAARALLEQLEQQKVQPDTGKSVVAKESATTEAQPLSFQEIEYENYFLAGVQV